MAVVELEDRVKATDCGPCRSAARRSAAAVKLSASSQPICSQPGSGSPFGWVRRSGWVQPLGMVDELRRSAALGAQRLAGRVFWIGFETGEPAMLHDRDRAASGDAKPAIRVNAPHAL